MSTYRKLVGSMGLAVGLVWGCSQDLPGCDPLVAVKSSVDLCPLDCPIRNQVAIIADHSDSIAPVPLRDAQMEVRRILNGLDPQSEVRIYAMGSAGRQQPQPAGRVCVPIHPDSTEKPHLHRESFEKYNRILDSLLTAALFEPPDSISPILESIQVVEINGRESEATGARHVMLISDMIQNSSQCSFFGRDPCDEVPEWLLPRAGELDVARVLLLRRSDQTDLQEGIEDWWRRYFEQTAVMLEDWTYIVGVSPRSD